MEKNQVCRCSSSSSGAATRAWDTRAWLLLVTSPLCGILFGSAYPNSRTRARYGARLVETHGGG